MKRTISLELSGICLIVYALPFLYQGRGLFYGSEFDLSLSQLLMFIWSVIAIAAGVLLIVNKIRGAAVVMSVSAAVYTAAFTVEYRTLWQGMIEDGVDRYVAVPQYLVTFPVLWSLTVILFAVTLYLRGPAALILAFVAAATQIAGTAIDFRLMGYVTGHPSPISIILPALMCAAVLFAGARLARRE